MKLLDWRLGKKIHELGLLHREVHVYLISEDKKIIFQHRAKDKDTYPDMYDAGVGGHVDPGDSYIVAAKREMLEESGIVANENDLILVTKLREKTIDEVTGLINNFFREIYFYKIPVKVADLKVEEGKSQGFVFFPWEELCQMTDEEKNKLIPCTIEEVKILKDKNLI